MSEIETRVATIRKIVGCSFRRHHILLTARYGDHSQDLEWIAVAHCCLVSDVLVDYHGISLSDSLSPIGELALFYAVRRYEALTCFKEWDDGLMAGLLYPQSTSLDLNGLKRELPRLFAMVDHGVCFSSVDAWHQILAFPTRVCVENAALLDQARDKYLAQEQAMGSYEYPDLSKVEARVRAICLLLLDPDLRSLPNHTARIAMFERYGWLPSHGPGTTADAGLVKSRKYDALTHDALLRYACPVDGTPDAVPRQCKVLFVPKSVTSLRTISAEPATLIWHGGGVQRLLYDALERNPHTNRTVNLYDASVGSTLARQGSRDGSFDTVDLSSASDFVTWALVKRLYSRTWLWPFLVALRSGDATLNGQTIQLKKAYPMGSRLCFPIMSITFAAIIESVGLDAGVPIPLLRYRVFGDDLVIPSSITEEVLRVLGSLHFVVNATKTFHGASLFREACGGEWYDGSSVRPLRLARKFCDFNLRDLHSRHDQVLQLIELSNAAFGYFSSLRLFCLETLRLHKIQCKFGEDPGCIQSSYANNHHLKSKFDSDLQKEVHQYDQGRCVVSVPLADGSQALLDWLSAAARSPFRENGLRGLDTPERNTSSQPRWG